jgi:hypothetical protein
MHSIFYILIGLAILGITLKIDQVTDYKLWRDNNPDNPIRHLRGGWLRLIGCVPACIVAWWLPFHNVWIFLAGSVSFALLYWNLFDGFFNNKRRFHWEYNGTDDPDDARTDNFLQQFSESTALKIKVGAFLISLGILITVFYLTDTKFH